MVNITISIPEELSERMKCYSEIKWSEVVRKALTSYVNKLQAVEGGVVPMKQLAKELKESGVDTSKISLQQAIDFYEEGKKLEWKRLSTTQTN